MMLENVYTTIPHQKLFIFQFYTFLGVVNRFLNLDPFLLFHLSSIFVSILLILAVYFLVKNIFTDSLLRISSFILIVLGGGLGWFTKIKGSADTVNAGFTMINAFERGHDALSTLFLILTSTLLILYIRKRSGKLLLGVIIFSFLNIVIHPPLILLYLVIATFLYFWLAKENQQARFIFYPLFLIILFVPYYFFVLQFLAGNPGFSGIGHTPQINIQAYIWGFGFMSLPLFWALTFAKDKTGETAFIKLFFITTLVFTLLPFSFSLYYLKTVHVWGVILALYGIRDYIIDKQLQRTTVIIVVALSLLTRIYVFDALLHASPKNSFFFLTKEEGKTLEFTSSLPVDSAILSLYRIGNYIPAFSDNRVYYGHRNVTPNSQEVLKEAQSFYTKMNEKEQKEFVRENNINYIYYGFEEARLRKEENLPIENPFAYFPVIFDNDVVIIYKSI